MRYLLFFLFSISAFSQSSADPRLRVSALPNTLLTTSWQTINFNASESLNVNTFGINPPNGKLMFEYDPVTMLFKYYGNYDNAFFISFQFQSTTTILTTRATLQLRFVIPNGVSSGVDFFFPFSDRGGYVDINEITLLSFAQNNTGFEQNIYTNAALRANGFKIQVRLSNALAGIGTSTLNYASLRIQGISKN
jgi:hypothetical protein